METLDEIIEDIADKCGVYGCYNPEFEDVTGHPEDCQCRICFTNELKDRILGAVDIVTLARIAPDLAHRKVPPPDPPRENFDVMDKW